MRTEKIRCTGTLNQGVGTEVPRFNPGLLGQYIDSVMKLKASINCTFKFFYLLSLFNNRFSFLLARWTVCFICNKLVCLITWQSQRNRNKILRNHGANVTFSSLVRDAICATFNVGQAWETLRLCMEQTLTVFQRRNTIFKRIEVFIPKKNKLRKPYGYSLIISEQQACIYTASPRTIELEWLSGVSTVEVWRGH